MIGYVVLGTNDLPRAAAFYDALLGELGLTRQMEVSGRGYAWGADMNAVMLSVMTPFDGRRASVGNGTMTAIRVNSREEVERVYARALELGGVDEGAPALREVYGAGFYAAYFSRHRWA
jgi:catechol 2,3-dioxygenase-like lactoylglutathione lyase family enzyme